MSTQPARVEPARAPGRRGRRGRIVAAFAAAWLVPAALYLVGLAFLLIPLFVAALVGLQRGTRTVLDGVVVGLAQAFGALCVAGLAFSLVGTLHPVVLAGTASTVLAAAYAARGWSAPRPYRPADVLVGLGTAGVAVLTVVPFALRDLGARLGILAVGEDFSRHFALVDQIGAFGAYAFMRPAADATLLADDGTGGIRLYPQGVHYGYAVLDHVLRSSGRPAGDAVVAMDLMIWVYVATFVLLALAVLWAAARVAGPGARPVALLPVLTVVAAWVYFGEPVAIFMRGFPNELVGLALAAVLTAVVVRPLTGWTDQLTTVALLVVGISFSYHLFLPYAGVLALAWAIRHRMWRRPAAVAVGAVALAASAVTPLLNLHATTTRQLTVAGTALASDRPALVALVVLAAAGLTGRGGLRPPARRTGLFALVTAVAALSALGLFQLATTGRTVYYFDKLLHLTVIVGLVLLGASARFVRRNRRATVVAVTAALCAALVGAGGANHSRVPSHGARLAAGLEKGSPAGGRDAVRIAGAGPADRAVDVSLVDTPYRNFHGTLFASVLRRDYRHGHAWYDFLNPAGPPRTLADLERRVVESAVPVRLHVGNPRASMLVLEPATGRGWTRHGSDPAGYGDPAALTNVDAARYLAERYPDRVQVVVEPYR